MQQSNQSLENKPVQNTTYNNRRTKLIILHIFAVLILIGGSVGITYWWRNDVANKAELKLQTQISNLQKNKINLSISTTGPDTTETDQSSGCSPVSPSQNSLDSIIAVISTGNTQPLEGYMADSVNVILAATEAYGIQTKDKAVASIITFTGDSATTTWDFNLGASTISSYGSGEYSQYFPSIALVGKSSDDKVISFSFDCDAKISTVFMAGSEDLLQ